MAIRFLLPHPPERIRKSAAPDDEVIAFVASTAQAPAKPIGPASASVQNLGKLLYQDNDLLAYRTGRSGQNESCAGCHQAIGPTEKDERKSPFPSKDRIANDLSRVRFYTTFGVAGLKQSLKDYVAYHIESRTELASNRIRMVRLVFSKYQKEYEQAFGPLPKLDINALPENGLPTMDRKEFPVAISSFILETLADRKQLANIIDQSQIEHLAPAVIVSKLMFAKMVPSHEDTESFYKLALDTQAQINAVFDNLSLALTGYIATFSLDAAPYDRFAQKVAETKSLEQSISTEFGADQLEGLRLFQGPAGCGRCHNGPGFTDNKYYNIGLPVSDVPDPGHATALVLSNKAEPCAPKVVDEDSNKGADEESVPVATALPDAKATDASSDKQEPKADGDATAAAEAEVKPEPAAVLPTCFTPEEEDQLARDSVGAFRTTALRGMTFNRRLTHNGQIETVDDMLEFYSQLDDHPAIGTRSTLLAPLDLTKEEKAALEAFLRTLVSGSKTQS